MRTIILMLCLFLVSCGRSPLGHTHGMGLSAEEIVNLQTNAENGDASAAMHLYTYYSIELHDETKAEKWLRVAASLKHPQAQRLMAYMIKSYNYSSNTFGESAPVAVLNLLEQAAKTEGNACYELASAYADGYFGDPDKDKARIYYLRGAKFNNRMCWGEISNYYQLGLGGPRDYLAAYYWISLEVRCVDPRSVGGKDTWIKREKIASHLSLSQLEHEWERIDTFISRVNANKTEVRSTPFLSGAIDPELESEGRRLSQKREDSHRVEWKLKKT